MSAEKLDLRNPVIAAVLAWAIPGLGHLYQRRFGKAVLYFVCIMGLYLFGIQQGTWSSVYFRWDQKEWSWPYLAQIGAGVVALPGLAQPNDRIAWERALDQLHRTRGRQMDFARMFTMIAGLLNLLVVYDALAGPALYHEEETLLHGEDKLKGESAAA